MIIYDDIELKTKRGSTIISLRRDKEIIHIPFTDKNKTIKKGRKPTMITSTIIGMTEAETNNILILLNADISANLQIGDKLFKDVEPDAEYEPVPQKLDKKDIWYIKAKFIALDPIPYDAETGEAIYD